MTFSQLFAILRARWKVASLTFFVVFAGVAIYTWQMPRSYTAQASIVLDVKNADPIAGVVSPSLATPAYLMTQVDVISSSRVARRVVKDLHLTDSPDMRTKWQVATNSTGDFDAWLATMIRNSLEARPSRGSNVIHVSYKAADPRFASVVANAFVQAYMDTIVELRNQPARQSKDFLDANARLAREALEREQARLSSYLSNQDLLVTDERLDVETTRLNELSNQYVMMQAAVADSSSRQYAARTEGDKSPDVMNSPLVSQLKGELIRQQTALEQLATRLGDAHPSVLELRTGISETSRKLDTEIRRATSSVGVGNSVNQSRLLQVKASLDLQRSKVLKLKAIRDDAAILQRDVDNAQRAYDGILARMNTSNLESQANLANVSILETAAAPSIPSSPRIFTNLTLGGLVALSMAMALALLIEHLDRRLRVAGEVEHMLNQAVIGSIPSFAKRKQGIGSIGERFQLKSAPALKALPNEA